MHKSAMRFGQPFFEVYGAMFAEPRIFDVGADEVHKSLPVVSPALQRSASIWSENAAPTAQAGSGQQRSSMGWLIGSVCP